MREQTRPARHEAILAELAFHSFLTFLVVLDPPGVAAVFAALSFGHSRAERRRMALRGVGIAALVLLGFALSGEALLDALGISVSALRISGGVLLFLLAMDMVFARPSGLRTVTQTEDREAHERADISVFPLAIPLIAGPGAIVSLLLLIAQAEDRAAAQALVIAVLLGVLLLVLVALLVAARLVRRLGETGVNVVGRVLGILLSALAVQFVLDGLREGLLGG